MKIATSLVLSLLMVATPSIGYPCGQGRSGKTMKRVSVPLKGEYSRSSFYLRGERGQIMFFSVADVVGVLSRRVGSLNAEGKTTAEKRSHALLAAINRELPLSGPSDLFKYALIESGFGTEIELLAADLLLDGKASIARWFDLHSAQTQWAKSIRVATKGRSEGEPIARWFCAMNDAPLLQITYILY